LADGAPFASLEGRRALVTGASKGIGRAIAQELARAGATVVVGYRSSRDDAEQLASELGGAAVEADVSSPEDAKRLVEEAGDIDVLVNNAGLTRDGLLARMSDDDWRTVIDTNLSSVFYTCRAVTRPMMKKRRGAIVNISSVVGVHGNWGQTNYAASKAGIIGFTKSLARELGSRNIRANVVAPGYVKTQLTEALPEEATAAMIGNTPLGRVAEPAEIAGAVRFLASDDASFITGEVLLVDGGLGM
jgi:3-oxoacyl-[acyl-carrier protein] reductase